MVQATTASREQANGQSGRRKPLYKQIYFWVLVGIALGILVGHFFPAMGVALEPVGTSFVNLIKMVIAPLIFFTVVSCIVGMQSMRSVGSLWLKALVYFEVLTTIALNTSLPDIN